MGGFVLQPHEGPAYGFHGSRAVIKVSGEQTFGQFTGAPHLDRQIVARGEPAPL